LVRLLLALLACGAALHHDAGIRVDRSTGDYEILRRPESRFALDDDFAERFERRRLVLGCSRGKGSRGWTARSLRS
jgi:hypothetical protein